jgi:hypothetical protein
MATHAGCRVHSFCGLVFLLQDGRAQMTYFKPTIRLLIALVLSLAWTYTGFQIGEGMKAQAETSVRVERLKAIQSMYAAIPWETKIEAKNVLLQAVCKKQKTKLCREIQDSFNSGQMAKR